MAFARPRFCALLVAALLLVPLGVSGQLMVGQEDDFEDGTTENWQVNLIPGMPVHPAPPANVPDGGPAGADDAYLLLTSVGGTGSGAPEPGSRLSVVNFMNQWSGNYLASGITHIGFDAINLGTSELFLRLLFENPMTGPPTDIASSATPVSLPVGSGWTPLLFPLYGPGGLAALMTASGTSDLTDLLTNTTAIRIYHDPDFGGLSGPPVVAQLGVDNITALSIPGTTVPEPMSMLLLGSGLIGLAVARRRRHRPIG